MNTLKRKHYLSIFSQHNIVLWLPVYSIIYLIFNIIYENNAKAAFLMGSMLCISITLIFFTAAELFENIHGEEVRKENLVAEVSKKIREEYQRARKVNRTKKLLLETKLEDINISKPKIEQKVHLSYLNRFNTEGFHENSP